MTTRRLSLAFFAILVGFLARPAAAQLAQYNSPLYGFALAYSTEFEREPTDLPQVALLLRLHGLSYPTFNIIVEQCPRELLNRSSQELGKRLESEYRHVGLIDADVKMSTIEQLQQYPAHRATLEYSSKGSAFVSSVLRIFANDRCFVLTYIDLAAEYKKNEFYRQQLEAGFSVSENGAGPSPTPPAHMSYYLPLAAGFVFLLALYLLRRRRKTPR